MPEMEICHRSGMKTPFRVGSGVELISDRNQQVLEVSEGGFGREIFNVIRSIKEKKV